MRAQMPYRATARASGTTMLLSGMEYAAARMLLSGRLRARHRPGPLLIDPASLDLDSVKRLENVWTQFLRQVSPACQSSFLPRVPLLTRPSTGWD